MRGTGIRSKVWGRRGREREAPTHAPDELATSALVPVLRTQHPTAGVRTCRWPRHDAVGIHNREKPEAMTIATTPLVMSATTEAATEAARRRQRPAQRAPRGAVWYTGKGVAMREWRETHASRRQVRVNLPLLSLGVVLTGRVVAPPILDVVACGSLSIVDLRLATFAHPVTRINVISAVGFVHVVLPPRVRVVCETASILGCAHAPRAHDEYAGFDEEEVPAPVVRLRSLVVVGAVRVVVDASVAPVQEVEL